MQKKKNNILIPVDFSDQSVIALDQSYNLANSIDAEITLLNVIEDHGLFNAYSSAKENDKIKKESEEKLSKLAKEKSRKYKIKINPLVARGKIYLKINEIAEMINATFIMMGTSGSMGIMKFIGSNTLRVIRESKIPVISIKGKHHRQGCKNIVLPLDLTKETKEKLAKAVWLSKLYGGAVVRAVSVLTTKDEFIVNKLTRQIAQAKSIIAELGVSCTAEIIKDAGGKTLAETIVDYAKKVDGDLLMIMTQQENFISEMFIGSTAQEIINTSEIPVMSIIPAPKKAAIIHTPF